MMGPFVDYNNVEINEGNLFYDTENGKVFATYEEIF